MSDNIILGITGGIAAYKSAYLASSLTKKDKNVDVVMTKAATEFISPLTFQSITGNSVEVELFTPPAHYDVKHVSLADKADLCLIAPATANFIAKMAQGLADDLLSTIVLAVQAPIIVAPAMNVHMYNNSIVQENIKILKEHGIEVIEPSAGYLACGYEGTGRLPEPDILEEYVHKGLSKNKLQDKKVLITAGPTREAIDPVRFLSNYSSGKMGFALAREAFYQGAEVTLIAGPNNFNPPPETNYIEIESAQQMNEEVKKISSEQDIIIMSAAVSDYRPEKIASTKIKKSSNNNLNLKLQKNPDILKTLGEEKIKNEQLLVGFAAESENLIKNAEKKLKSKNLDLIIANDISREDIGLGSEDNEVTILSAKNKVKLTKNNKNKIAEEIFNYIFENWIH